MNTAAEARMVALRGEVLGLKKRLDKEVYVNKRVRDLLVELHLVLTDPELPAEVARTKALGLLAAAGGAS
jgi:hypothetical protein